MGGFFLKAYFFFSFLIFGWLVAAFVVVSFTGPPGELLSLVKFADVTLWEKCQVVPCPSLSPPA